MASTIVNMDRCGVAWFKMDESTGNLVDSKGNFVGTNFGTTSVPGVSGNARNFNGSSSYITFNNPVIPLGKKSVRFRIKKASRPAVAQVVWGNAVDATIRNGIYCSVEPAGHLAIAVLDARGWSDLNINLGSGIDICDNEWHDVLFTWDGTTNVEGARFFVDDMVNPKSRKTAKRNETAAPGFNLTIGKNPEANSNFLLATLDGLEVYNDVISNQPDRSVIFKDSHYFKFFPGFMEWRAVGNFLTKSILDQHGVMTPEEWTEDVSTHRFNSTSSYSSGAGKVFVTPVTSAIPTKSIHVQ
ncbi:hypothetical protein A7K91_04910 [Paenibacillus oryzae]|uniref:LamG-like jellyroll fold domain-containing protein n=1 Tax=Paenibacillus oryzae TaxID=1844972 RepID=A0A1A5YH93_9BACL|nr:LamG-like jellyroll fold domain-containing protein [Paenibacillus oryzae]OBR64923.1 hypothetical protein A7K91_04910 [Paenibacillus oryzae]